MGQLISGLNLRPGDSLIPELGFDLENATPSSDDELQLYRKLSVKLVKQGQDLIQLLKNHIPASEQVHNAIAKATPENENIAWVAVSPTVDLLQDIYEYSTDLQDNLPMLLNALCSDDTNGNLGKNQGLAKLFTELLNFVFEFDSLKMCRPDLQNDFSYYRRVLQRGRNSASSRSANANVSDLRNEMSEEDQANRISFFIASPTPMLKCIIDITTKFVLNDERLQERVGYCLTILWATCRNTADKKRNQNPERSPFLMKVMVVSIILYDHIAPNGAFYKKSPINIKESVKIIKTSNTRNSNDHSAENLLSTLRFNSKHLGDIDTPKDVKQSLAAAA